MTEPREAGIKEALAVLSEMERRYVMWLEKPTMYVQDTTKGKLQAIQTAKRAVAKLLTKKE